MSNYRIYTTFINAIAIIAVDVLFNGEWFRDNEFIFDDYDNFEYFSNYLTEIVAKNNVAFPTEVTEKNIRSADAIDDLLEVAGV